MMGRVRIDRLDHLVLTVADLDATVAFYTRVLGMEAVTFGPTGQPDIRRAPTGGYVLEAPGSAAFHITAGGETVRYLIG